MQVMYENLNLHAKKNLQTRIVLIAESSLVGKTKIQNFFHGDMSNADELLNQRRLFKIVSLICQDEESHT